MSLSSVFHVKEHVLEGSHIREFPRALSRSQEDVLKLAVKEYIPKDNPTPKAGDITIIGAHANGFPKELYEALWLDLHAESLKPSSTFRIRSVIIADVAWQGASSALNEPLLGNDPGWLRRRLPRRRLRAPPRPRKAFLKSSFYRAWDGRVFDAWVDHGLRDVPTQLYPASDATPKGSVTLATTKHQEVFTFFRPSWYAYDPSGRDVVRQELVPDLDPALNERYFTFPFYRSEGASTLVRLPNLRPGVLYVFGGASDLSTPELREEKMRLTGTGVGGSGGAARGKVREVTLPGAGHLFPMEVPDVSAKLAAEWIEKGLGEWRAEQEDYERWTRLSVREKTTLTEEWMEKFGAPARPPKAKM
ncbi:Abhydrolase domain-containing protein mpaH [Colletotrichum liriopes]|uniref:Abhydrolase domain-containing protein mpaH n=1 Tax=Colletotrichum liriopes TaxID=708192 RepID=A0AA37H189_9PEZI|nr:Abhydrolase domain-containing protein mpaH [Colletotrichum liriopes]